VLQESGVLPVDPIFVDGEIWIGCKIYWWFLLATLGWATFKIFRVWLRVPPFSSKAKQASGPDRVRSWQRLARSVARWAGLVLIGAALLVSIALCRMASEPPQIAISTGVFLSVERDVGVSLIAAFFVVLVLYLIRWHLVLRIERHNS
jgi:hypothetical protein